MCHIEMAPISPGSVPRRRRSSGGTIHVTYHASWCTRGGTTPWNGNWMIYCDRGYLEMVDNQVFIQTEDDAA